MIAAARRWEWQEAVVVAAAAVVAGALALHLRMLFDDSFIGFRYADNLGRGRGLVFNPGERVEGYTCLLWVLLLAAVARAGLDVVAWSHFLGAAAAAATVVVTAALATRLVPPSPRWARLVAPILLATHPAFALWAGSGMETALFALLVSGATLAWVRDPGGAASGVLLALGAMTRPEGVLWGAAFAADQLRHGLRRWAWLAAAVVLLLPQQLWRLAYYGYPLPNTFYAKVGGGVAALGGGLDYLTASLGPGGGAILGALAALGIAADRSHRALWLTLLGLVAAYVVWVGGDVFPMHRFLVPVLPVVTALAAAGVAAAWERLGRRTASMGLAFVGVGLVFLYARELERAEFTAAASTRLCIVARGVAGYLARATGPEEPIAAMGVGVLAYYGDRPVVDMLGLTDVHIAHREVPMGTGVRGHEKYDADYVLSRRPAFIVLPSHEALIDFVTWSAGAETARTFPGLPALDDMASNPRFRADYLPDRFGTFRRRDPGPTGGAP